jgi:histidinol-phosphate aminotransferase
MPRKPAPPKPAAHIERLTPYHPGTPIAEVERELGITNIIKLASNENALGPSPSAVEAIRAHAEGVNMYPEGSCPSLRSSLASRLGTAPESLTFGNGSDEIIHFLGLAFLQPGDEVIQGDPTFSRYEAAATLAQAACVRVPLRDWRYDLGAIAKAITPRTRIVFVANPNNPTGSHVTQTEFNKLLDAIPDRCIVCMDEAYFEYVTAADYPDSVKAVREGANVLVLRTFSKLYGLAGLRIGYGIARPEIIAAIEQVREPFNVNHLAQVAAIAALDDKDHCARSRAVAVEGRQWLAAELGKLGLEVWPSQANFIWVDLHRPCRPVFDALLRSGVIVRTGDAFGAPSFLRITVGTREQNARLVETMRKVLTS